MKTSHKALLALSIAGVLGGMSLGANAANVPAGSTAGLAAAIAQLPHEVQRGSIPVKADNEQAMATQARIGAAEAAQIAAKALPGKVVESQLDAENGYLIWEVSLLTDNGRETQLKLDAGNGQLLAAEQDERDEHPQDEHEDEDHEDQAENSHGEDMNREDHDQDEHDGRHG